jgi:iron complex transport system permease protein
MLRPALPGTQPRKPAGNDIGPYRQAIQKMFSRISPFGWCTLALLGSLLLSAGMGAVFIPPLDVARILFAHIPFLQVPPAWPAAWETILFSIRLPRTVLIAMTGAALAGSGSAYQGLFRNPLADPYLIGVASGAGLGAVAAMSIQWPASELSFLAIPFAAFLGALLAVILVYALSRVGATTPVTTLLLAGVAIGSFASAITSYLMLRSDGELHRAVVWLLGGYSLGGWEPVLAIAPYLTVGLGGLILLGHPLNVLQFGDEQAQQMGLNVERVKRWLILAATLSTAAAVAFSGTIGFVGLVVPHALRLVWGTDYRRLLPLSIIGGAAALLLADVAARTVTAPQEIPVGIVTALVGAPFFLWLLRRAKERTFW